MDSPLGVLTLPGEAAFEEKEAFLRLGYSIGGFMVWPSNKVDRRMAINGTRGFTVRIADRMDLTLECIRRHYRGETSPLAAALTRYEDFFALFEDFRCYVDFLPPAGPRRRRGTGPVLPPPRRLRAAVGLGGPRRLPRLRVPHERLHPRPQRADRRDAAARDLRDVPPVGQE